MNAASLLRSRTLASVALGVVTLLLVAGAQQAATRVIEVELPVLAPLAIAVGCLGAVVLAGGRDTGWRRTPYW